MTDVEATSWAAEVADLRERQRIAAKMGGEDAVQKQHDRGRQTVRERISQLFDPESFRETGSIAGRRDGSSFVPANTVCGRGTIDGRPVVVVGDDFTVRGGSVEITESGKTIYPEKLANEYRLPLVRLVESGGGSIKTLEAIGRTYVPANPGWDYLVSNLSTVPVVALAMGPCGGIAAARVSASHYSVMVRGTSQAFAGGPPLVARQGETIDKESLGGAAIQTRNGTVLDAVDSESEAFEQARRFLSYLPSSVYELPPRAELTDDPRRRDESLLSAIPRNRRKPHAIRPIIETIVDKGSFFEMGKNWGRSIVTGLARLDGWPVAVLSTDARYGAAFTADGARKTEWFADLAETFHLPVVHLVDQPGLPIGSEAERAGTMRYAVRATSAVYQASVPWCSIIIRRAFGVGGAAHSNAERVQIRYAWPSAEWGSLPNEGGVDAAFRSHIENSDDPAAERARLIAEMDAVRSPMLTAEDFGVEEIIDPRDTRALLCEFANLAAPLRRPGRSSWGFRG
ncbi:acyl-CoA carboxylase subunit beta [Cumulibacter soli]|uniref:acyl-CoA carboxylase subunit beta n=1 Tax=Cumulibacter soli TaxID=2546344 RepID=UPI0010678C3D|nr:carboxyl transferase domain-containing protein [Cumulibacter soli]